MDVRGPIDPRDANSNLSRVRRELVRYEAAEGTPITKGAQRKPSTEGSEITRLTRELRALPEVREELVASTLEKLREGQFSTRQSAERTAAAVLRTTSKE